MLYYDLLVDSYCRGCWIVVDSDYCFFIVDYLLLVICVMVGYALIIIIFICIIIESLLVIIFHS